jgi:hypothetical protein
MVTFQQMLILADSQGVVDMTVGAMSRTTGIPVEILSEGIAALEAPDPASRSPDVEGRRIARLDAHRSWGWFLVNFSKYRAMQTREEKNEADRERMRSKRAAERSNASQGVASCSNVSPTVASVADVAHTDTDLDTEESKSIAPNGAVGDADKPKKLERLAQVTAEAVAAFNATLSKKAGGFLSAVTLPNSEIRRKQVKRTLRLASQACESLYGSPTVTPEFWQQYFEEVQRDDFKSGRGPYVGAHANWRPDFDYLTKPETVEKVIDDALSRLPA